MQLHNNPIPEKTAELLQIWDTIFQDEKFRKRGPTTQCLDYAKEISIKENCYKMMLRTGSKKKAHWIFTERQGTTVMTKQHLFNGYSVAKETLDLYS